MFAPCCLVLAASWKLVAGSFFSIDFVALSSGSHDFRKLEMI